MSRQLGLKRPKLTAREERLAYEAATARDQGQCQRCGRWGPMDRDHRQNRDAWNTVVSNLQLLGGAFGCGCHKWKTEHPAEAIAEGFAVPRHGDPREWPAWRYEVGWVLYYDRPDERGNWWKTITETEARAMLAELGA